MLRAKSISIDIIKHVKNQFLVFEINFGPAFSKKLTSIGMCQNLLPY